MKILWHTIILALVIGILFFISPLIKQTESVKASNTYETTSANLIVGTSAAKTASNVGHYKGAYASDNIYWSITRTAAIPSLDVQFTITGVQLKNANKLMVTIEDSNTSTATPYQHMICDWVSDVAVDFAADSNCTGGGWRIIHQRKLTYTSTSDANRTYEIFNGYFVDRSVAAPGTVIDTPLSNFIGDGSNNVLIRIYSSDNSTTQYNIDYISIDTGIDPVYEPAEVTSASGNFTNYLSDLTGLPTSTNVNGSDSIKLRSDMPAINQPIDLTFIFKNVRTYTGANTILFVPEVCVNNVALTFDFQLKDFNTNSWTDISETDITGTICGTADTEYAMSFNSITNPGFILADHISGSNEIHVRMITAAPGTIYNTQIDRMYLMIGSVNTDSARCEISWGTGTDTDCTNTRSINESKTSTTTEPTWQAAATLEYPSSYYALDNDDDGVNDEYAASQNLSFPVTIEDGMIVTAIHWATKYRSNSTAQTADLQVRDSSGITIAGTVGWQNTPGNDANTSTTYGWYDSFVQGEYLNEPSRAINTTLNEMNLRLRTSAGSTTDPGTRDWAFAMMSIRWVEEAGNRTRNVFYAPTGGNLVAGSETATSASNTGSWKGVLGSEELNNNLANYWTVARSASDGLNLQIQFDNVQLYGATHLIVTIEDTNITTGNTYTHQICDWVDTTEVDNAADVNCTGGGWRTLEGRRTISYANVSDQTRVYRIYNGYFSSRSVSPGTAVDTPLSNFVRNDPSKRVLIRTYSTTLSTVQYRMDHAQVEVAIEHIYRPSSLTKINNYSGATTNYLGETFDSDGNKLIFTNSNTDPMDFYFSFTDIKTYIGMNTVLIRPETCANNTALTFNFSLYNFSNTSWVDFASSPITGSVCGSDTQYAYALNNLSDMNDYISAGELRIRMYTTTNNTNTFQIDQFYMMLGTTNSDNTLCEISWGSGTSPDCTHTRDVEGIVGGSAAVNTWQNTSVLEYPASPDYYGFDNDNDGVHGEAAFASNISFNITKSSGMSITGLTYALRFRSNTTGITIQPQFRDFSGRSGGGGWGQTIAASNTLTAFNFNDSTASSLSVHSTNVNSFYNEVTNRINMRLRTTASTTTTAGAVNDWDFAMVSLRWIEDQSGVLSVDIVDENGASVASPSVQFPNKITTFDCQTSTGIFGTSTEKIRVSNLSNSPAWSLSISANGGSTSSWNTSGLDKYDFNDGSGSGCSDGADADSESGQLTIDLSSAVITPKPGCSNTGITLGSNSGFEEGTTDSLLIVQASGSTGTNCYWDITGISVTQKIPSSQPSGSYSIPMSLSVVTN